MFMHQRLLSIPSPSFPSFFRESRQFWNGRRLIHSKYEEFVAFLCSYKSSGWPERHLRSFYIEIPIETEPLIGLFTEEYSIAEKRF